MTGGAVVSPLHRVVSDGESERYSLVFFYYPHYDTCLPSGQGSNLKLSLLMDQSVKYEGNDDDQKKNGTEGVTFGEVSQEICYYCSMLSINSYGIVSVYSTLIVNGIKSQGEIILFDK